MSKKPAILSPATLRDLFARSLADTGSATDGAVVQNLSRALAALQQAGIDLTFTPSGWCGSDSFRPLSGGGSATFSGMLSFGNNSHLLSLLTKKDGTSMLALSYFNSRLGELDNRVWTYDVTDEDCYVNLQERIIALAVRNRYLADNDVAGAFSHDGAHAGGSRVTLFKPAGRK